MADEQTSRVRPSLIYTLVLFTIIAIGIFSIRAIHASAPELTGFDVAAVKEVHNQSNENSEPQTIPASVQHMREQRWVAPASLQVYKRQRRNSELPPEIAAVQETVIDLEVIKPEGGGYAPPPPMAGADNLLPPGDDLFAPQLRDGEPSSDAVIVQGDPTMPQPGADPTAIRDKIGSMLATINNQGQPTQPPQQATPKPKRDLRSQSLSQAMQSVCADRGFIARIACEDKVRTDYCAGRWNQVNDCNKGEDAGDF